jgi:hypothetical protein
MLQMVPISIMCNEQEILPQIKIINLPFPSVSSSLGLSHVFNLDYSKAARVKKDKVV